MNKNNFYRIISYLMIISGIVGLGLILYYILFVSSGYYHADCTDTIMWAEAALEGNGLMNPDFGYACLMPFGGELLMMPFVAIFGVGMKAQLMGMAVFALIFTFALVYLCKSMGLSYKYCSVTVFTVLLVISASPKLREIFWCHIIYYSLGVLFLMVGLAFVINLLKNEVPKIRHFIFLLVWTMLCATNGSQALTLYILPVLAAVVAERFFDLKTPFFNKSNRREGLVVLAMGAGTVIGLLIAKLLNGDITAGYQSGYSGFDNMSDWADNFINILPELFRLFGITSVTGELFSLDGIMMLIRIICVLILITVPVIMLCMYKKFEERSYRLMILAHTFLSVLIIMGWVFGKLNAACWRLSPILATSAILCVMFVRYLYKTKALARLTAIIIIPVSIVLFTIFADICTDAANGQSDENKKLEAISEYLAENDLEYGYATFWNANIITLMTDSDIKVRCISVDNNRISQRFYQTNINWYKDNSYNSYFILLTDSEYGQYLGMDFFPEPQNLLEYEDYHILVYDYNIMEWK